MRGAGSIRRKLLDQIFSGLRLIRENKLREYQRYYNERRAHTGRYGDTPIESRGDHVIALNNY